MKNRLYYVLFIVYAMVVVFVLYMNGVFTGEEASFVNLAINIGFLVIIGILFLISCISFGRLNRCTGELTEVMEQMQRQYRDAGSKNVWALYQDRKDVFEMDELNTAFNKYRLRMKGYRTKRGYSNACDLEEYINEELIERVGLNFYNSGISGTLTGLGILGTFLGLSMGLGSFNGDDIYTISDNVGPLLSGMKVAFHTSVYGILFSLIFNIVYRSIMSDAYEKLENFQAAFRQFAMPTVAGEDENMTAMLVYQANMANSMKQMLDLLKGNALEQTQGVEKLVNQFTDRLQGTLGVNLQRMGNAIKVTSEAQGAYVNDCKNLIEATTALVEVNRNMQDTLTHIMNRQEELAKELEEQKHILQQSCEEMCEEVSTQLYTFDKMREDFE